MKLLVDMNLSPRWVNLLRKAGLEAVHRSTIGRANARDTEIMAWAAANNHVVLTQDMDFRHHPGRRSGRKSKRRADNLAHQACIR